VDGIYNGFRKGDQKLAVIIPTGGGKSAIMGRVARDFLDKKPNGRVIILSHLGLLTSQTGNRFKSDWGIETGVLQADNYPGNKKRCIISTMQSFRNPDKLIRWSMMLGSLSPSIDRLEIGLIIVDEAHFATCDSYTSIIEMFPKAKIIGFTATPFKANKLMTNVFDSVAYTISMQTLIDQGYLVKPEIKLTPFDVTDQTQMFGMILQIYQDKYLGKKAVVYLKTIEEAELCRNVFIMAEIDCRAVTSKLTGSARDELLEDYRAGRGPNVLTTVDVLTAGFDSPNLQCIFMPYKVGSVTTFLQRIGRGLRPCKEIDKKHCDIYVGSDSPGIKAGFWEKITKQMLNQGRKDYTNLQDIIDFGQNDYSKEEYTWTKEVVAIANKAQKLGMPDLYRMIVNQELPSYLIHEFVENPPSVPARSTIGSTVAQDRVLKSMGINARLLKNEANNIISRHMKAKGIKGKTENYVQTGKHQGKHYSSVPYTYWKVLATKFPASEVYQGYLRYKRSLKEG